MTGRSETPSFSPKKWVCIRSTHSRAARATAKIQSTRTGSPVPGRRITERYLTGSGTRCLFLTGKKTVEFAKAHGVNKIAFELHPGFCVYNTDSMKKIREAVGPELGANLDPSHLIWQGMDPVKVISELGDAIFHFHAKDTRVDKYNTAINGVLDTKPYGDLRHRSWLFRTVGFGNGEAYWRDIISALKLAGYDYAVSIEHEDALMSKTEGLEKAASFLKPLLIAETAGKMWWA